MKFLRRLRYLLHQRQIERDLAEEIDFHKEMNLDPREMGNLTRSREDARAVWIWPWLQSVWQDLAYGFRNLRREPGFTLIAVIALGIAIGLNTSLFTVFNAVALRPWPVKEPRRIVKILTVNPSIPRQVAGLGVAEYKYFAQQSKSFSGLMLTLDGYVQFGFEAFDKPSHAVFVAADHFRVLGVGMQQGRGFLPEEDTVGAPESVMVLSYALWRDRFGSDEQIAGKQIRVNDLPFTVVGVTPEEFTGTSSGREDVYFPMAAMTLLSPDPSSARAFLTKPEECCGSTAGRLAPGVSQEQARAELEVLSRQFDAQFGFDHDRTVVLASPTMLGPGQKPQVVPALILMFTGVTLIMLLACANIGNLLVARAGARRREIQVRRSLGATRARIVRQLLTESLLLSAGAAALGLLMAWRLPGFVLVQAAEAPNISLSPDGTVLAYTLLLAGFACVCFGLAPALHGTRPAQSPLRLRRFLLATQVALSVVLLVGAGLMLEGVRHARSEDPGFAIADVSVISFEFPARDYDAQHTRPFYVQLSEDLKSAPDFESFGLAVREPLARNHYQTPLRLAGESKDRARIVEFQEVTPGYFDVLRIPIVAGRTLTQDDAGILLNEAAAARYWPGESAVGRSVVIGETPRQVVGVVKDTYTSDLDRIEPMFYQPFSGTRISKVLIRSSAPAAAEAVAAIASRIDPHVRTQITPLSENIERQLSGIRVGATLAGALGIFALALATIGMFGVFAYAVQQRTKEIGIRMALGGRPVQVIRLVLGDSSRAAAVGLAAGLAGAVSASRLTVRFLYGVSPMDARAYLSAGIVLVIAALVASYVPARRVTRIDPMSALRHE
jgi:predicted permease